jgi:hypothetical protein
MAFRNSSKNYKNQSVTLVATSLVLKGTINNGRACLSLAFPYRGL